MTDDLVERLLTSHEYDPALLGEAAAAIVVLRGRIEQWQTRCLELDAEIVRMSRLV